MIALALHHTKITAQHTRIDPGNLMKNIRRISRLIANYGTEGALTTAKSGQEFFILKQMREHPTQKIARNLQDVEHLATRLRLAARSIIE